MPGAGLKAFWLSGWVRRPRGVVRGVTLSSGSVTGPRRQAFPVTWEIPERRTGKVEGSTTSSGRVVGRARLPGSAGGETVSSGSVVGSVLLGSARRAEEDELLLAGVL